MKAFTIGKNDAGQRLDRFIAKTVPLLPASLSQKYIRLKRIKVNGSRAQRDSRLQEGDLVEMYVNDEFFDTPKAENAYLTVSAPKLNLVYEDENILLCDKRPGLAVHPHDGAEYGRTLIDHIQAYLYAKGEWRPREEHAFAPALCNRIDRNTGGIVIAAKNAEALRVMNEKTLASSGDLSLVECELITGRTHQIRAQFASAGHPLLGDGKYGRGEKRYNRKYQALYSYRLTFAFQQDGGILQYLNGKTFQVQHVDFVSEYFPKVQLDCISPEKMVES